MANFTGIVYLTEGQFTTLKNNGTITVNGITLNYDENTLYVTPETNNGSPTNVTINNVHQDTINFTSDPQTQIDEIKAEIGNVSSLLGETEDLGG
jgi:sugar lactone lactonase YvrE